MTGSTLEQVEVDNLRTLVESAQWGGFDRHDEHSCPWCGEAEGRRVHSIDCLAAIVMGWARRGAP